MKQSIVVSIALVLGGIFGACAAAPKRSASSYEVSWPDDSRSQPLWACIEDPNSEGRIMCMDFKEVVEMAMPGALECEARRRSGKNEL
jgi:hypothetical protein